MANTACSPIPARWSTRAAINHYGELFDLDVHGQDWELEVADGGRVAEFLGAYDAGFPDDDHGFTLMSLIVASYDELSSSTASDVPDAQVELLWGRIEAHLRERFELHAYTVQYWARVDIESEDPDMLFSVSPRMRGIMRSIYGPWRAWPREPFVVARAELTSERLMERPPDPSLEFSLALRSVGGDAISFFELIDNQNGQGFSISWGLHRAHAGGNGTRSVGSGELRFSSKAEALRSARADFGIEDELWHWLK